MQQLTLTATDENLSAVNDFIHEAAAPFNPPEATMLKVDLAVEELFVNIAHYAYAPDTGNVTIECSVSESPATISISLIDSGIPYNPLEKEDPDITQKLEDRAIGGMGIFLTKQYMDNISYNYTDGKNKITIQKKL
ncbi:MAG TPA: ATP-binding protein [Treponema sp.]|nr:ATP-binding protein [Treponema sp.]HBD68385.1 ATP-binding protein [Treponema sp.]